MHRLKNNSDLNSKIWLPDKSLRPEVLEILTNFYLSFMMCLSAYTGVQFDIDSDTADVLLVGPNTGYIYDKKSEINIIVLLRLERYFQKMHPDVFINMIEFIKDFFSHKYIIDIYGINVKIEIPISEYKCFQGYSLIQKKWIMEPIRLTDTELKNVRINSDKIYKTMRNEILSILKNKANHCNAMQKVYELKICNAEYSNKSFIDSLEFSFAYSRIINSGLIEKLINADKILINNLLITG